MGPFGGPFLGLGMNHDFIERAEKITSFNITVKELQTVDFKQEIRYLFGKHFFPGVSITGIDTVDKDNINGIISALKATDANNFKQLHTYNLKGVGPGEMTLYYTVDSAVLGGGSSAGVDIRADCGEYEVKAVAVNKDRVASNFKIGGTIPLHDYMLKLDSLREELNLYGSKTEIPKTTIDTMRQKAPIEFGKIENSFAHTVCDYFGNHKTIFINHNSSISNQGYVECIKHVSPDEVAIERVTSGTIKPSVRL